MEQRIRFETLQGEKCDSVRYVSPDSHVFVKNKKVQSGDHFLRCSNVGCLVRATLKSREGYIVTRGEHNHAQQLEEVRMLRFWQNVRQRITREDTSVREIYADETARIQDLQPPNYDKVRSKLFKFKSRGRAPLPRNVNDYVNIIEQDARVQNAFKIVTTNSGEEQSLSVLFIARGTRRTSLESCQSLYIDATFRSTPPHFFQLMTLHIVIRDEVFPAVYVLMERKDREAYVAVFSRIREELPGLSPYFTMTDFETGLNAALSEVFPETVLTGCWFHYTQAIWRKSQALGLTRHYRDDEEVKMIIKMIMAIPLLPVGSFGQGLNVIENNIAALPLRRRAGLRRLFEYLNDFWIQVITPTRLSVFGKDRRTNNSVEAFYSSLRRWIGVPRPNIYVFLGKLLKIDEDQKRKLECVLSGQWVRRRGSIGRRRMENALREVSQQLERNELTVENFLRRVCHFTAEIDQNPDAEEMQVDYNENRAAEHNVEEGHLIAEGNHIQQYEEVNNENEIRLHQREVQDDRSDADSILNDNIQEMQVDFNEIRPVEHNVEEGHLIAEGNHIQQYEEVNNENEIRLHQREVQDDRSDADSILNDNIQEMQVDFNEIRPAEHNVEEGHLIAEGNHIQQYEEVNNENEIRLHQREVQDDRSDADSILNDNIQEMQVDFNENRAGEHNVEEGHLIAEGNHIQQYEEDNNEIRLHQREVQDDRPDTDRIFNEHIRDDNIQEVDNIIDQISTTVSHQHRGNFYEENNHNLGISFHQNRTTDRPQHTCIISEENVTHDIQNLDNIENNLLADRLQHTDNNSEDTMTRDNNAEGNNIHQFEHENSDQLTHNSFEDTISHDVASFIHQIRIQRNQQHNNFEENMRQNDNHNIVTMTHHLRTQDNTQFENENSDQHTHNSHDVASFIHQIRIQRSQQHNNFEENMRQNDNHNIVTMTHQLHTQDNTQHGHHILEEIDTTDYNQDICQITHQVKSSENNQHTIHKLKKIKQQQNNHEAPHSRKQQTKTNPKKQNTYNIVFESSTQINNQHTSHGIHDTRPAETQHLAQQEGEILTHQRDTLNTKRIKKRSLDARRRRNQATKKKARQRKFCISRVSTDNENENRIHQHKKIKVNNIINTREQDTRDFGNASQLVNVSTVENMEGIIQSGINAIHESLIVNNSDNIDPFPHSRSPKSKNVHTNGPSSNPRTSHSPKVGGTSNEYLTSTVTVNRRNYVILQEDINDAGSSSLSNVNCPVSVSEILDRGESSDSNSVVDSNTQITTVLNTCEVENVSDAVNFDNINQTNMNDFSEDIDTNNNEHDIINVSSDSSCPENDISCGQLDIPSILNENENDADNSSVSSNRNNNIFENLLRGSSLNEENSILNYRNSSDSSDSEDQYLSRNFRFQNLRTYSDRRTMRNTRQTALPRPNYVELDLSSVSSLDDLEHYELSDRENDYIPEVRNNDLNDSLNNDSNDDLPSCITCRVCLIKKIEYVAEPCRHFMFCRICKDKIINHEDPTLRICSVCRLPVANFRKLFTPF